jgi:hypothetical protein
MRCEELLYVSDTARESHYTLASPKNKGMPPFCLGRLHSNTRAADAQIAGKIVTDMTFLRNKGLATIIYPKSDASGVTRGHPHYRVEYDLVVIVEGRNMRYEARWPPMESMDDDQVAKKRKRSGQYKFEVLQTAQVSIASAFQPGTG